MDAPTLSRTYYSTWDDGSGNLEVIMQSTPTSTDPQHIDHAQIMFHQHNRSILVGAPSDMENVVNLTSPIHETWLEGLQGLASFEQTMAGQAILAHIHSTPYLPEYLQNYYINAVLSEAQDSARIAASREHRAVRMVFHLNISVIMMFDDDYDSSAEDGEDAAAGYVEMDAAMGLGDAGVDAVTANVEEDASSEVEAMAGSDAAQPVDLEAVEVVGGLSPEAIANHLTVDNFMGADPETCAICLQNIAGGTPVGWLPCAHVYHPYCIADWLKRSGTCPICRLQLPDIGGN
ncbi:uncharacterized protein LOC120110385 [Phoenix dactylifera]|uniref:Uncharacterized protein LOC120110385 n=1 Tax=Phoenix dactylifera TaxID=42345 RepID=A0A8B9AB40_PHODC|nr:uncharacterized protein LOC120110385 [Phoenix dactylifera]